MIYIENNYTDAAQSFALEYYLMTEKRLSEDVFMLWKTSPTLMIGKYQNTLAEINHNYAEKRNIEVVRRLSGGGTIYTDPGGWQFTFISRSDHREIHFQEYIAPIVQAIQNLGVDATFNGRNDLVIDGRKFSGNAQYKLGGYTLHHGSLLFSTDLDEMTRCTTVDDHKVTSKGIKSVRDRVTNISEHLPYPMTSNEFRCAIVSHIMGIGCTHHTLSGLDHARIEQIASERFRGWDNVFGSNPQTDLVKTGYFTGGKVEFRFNLNGNTIHDVYVFGDFFGDIDPLLFQNTLKGCRYTERDILNTLQSNGFQNKFYQISLEELACCMIS